MIKNITYLIYKIIIFFDNILSKLLKKHFRYYLYDYLRKSSYEKIDVNGENSHPIFTYLRSELSGLLGNKIKWNFTKFLIGKDGQPIKRFAPTKKPEDLESIIQKALAA